MNHPFLHSALRELQVFTRSWRFWSTFALVILIFTVSGPFGTFERMTPGMRFGYWLTVHAVTWAIAIAFAIAADVALRERILQPLTRMMIGSVIAALPIGFALGVIDFAFSGDRKDLGVGLERALLALPLCIFFCLLSYTAMRRQIAEASTSPVSNIPEPEILHRLNPQNRGSLVRLSVEDHYTQVVTTRGRELVLLRFSDALKELQDVPGLQVHRSHWVADAHVDRLKRDGGKLFVTMKDGTDVPVSRPHLAAVKARFGGI